jgi:heptosyltransferase II
VTLPEHDKVRRILIRGVNWIGDAVMTTPAIGVVREHYPQAEITVLANPMVAAIFSPHDWVDEVMVFDRNGAHRGVMGRLRLASELRKRAFDLAIILPNSFDSALVPWLAGIPVRLGKSSDGRSLLLTGRFSEDETPPLRHEVRYYLNLVRHFGIEGTDLPPRLCTTPAEERAVEVLLAGEGIRAGDHVIAINPGATYGSAKRWYPDRFADVARRLAAEWRARIVILGSAGEADIAADIAQRLGGACLSMAGRTTVRELMALIKRSDFMITNDSGPMHIAAAFGVPLAAIFGPTDHTGTAPYTGRAVIVRKDVACAPCKLRECPADHCCMTAVTADDVVAAALALWDRHHG